LSDLVGELSTRSEEFRTWWAAHNVRYHQTGIKRLRHVWSNRASDLIRGAVVGRRAPE
jgi:hypothetical protein